MCFYFKALGETWEKNKDDVQAQYWSSTIIKHMAHPSNTLVSGGRDHQSKESWRQRKHHGLRAGRIALWPWEPQGGCWPGWGAWLWIFTFVSPLEIERLMLWDEGALVGKQSPQNQKSFTCGVLIRHVTSLCHDSYRWNKERSCFLPPCLCLGGWTEENV